MQLIVRSIVALFVVAVTVTAASAQSVSPLRKEGTTLSSTKAFYVNVSNPYKVPMVFSLRAMETDFETPAKGSVVRPERIKLGVNRGRRVIVKFKIPEGMGERKIALCVEPEGLQGPIQPRVCGTYAGKRLRRR